MPSLVVSRVKEIPAAENPSFVLLDTRAPRLVPGWTSAWSREPALWKDQRTDVKRLSVETLFVVYCNGRHCNGADRGEARLARLGKSVEKMIGGIEGWKDEDFKLTHE